MTTTTPNTPLPHGPSAQDPPRNRSKLKEYFIWAAMIRRCSSPRCKEYPWYGARGIHVDPRWRGRGGFRNFYRDLGPQPFRRASLDRVDNHGNYEPGNVRWVDHRTQMRNTRSNHLITFQGRTQPLVVWAEELGLRAVTLAQRLRRGWTVERALTQPVQRRKPYVQWRPRKTPRRPPALKPHRAEGEASDVTGL